jgi:hypothetical protein
LYTSLCISLCISQLVVEYFIFANNLEYFFDGNALLFHIIFRVIHKLS